MRVKVSETRYDGTPVFLTVPGRERDHDVVHQKRFHGFSARNGCVFDRHFSAIAMELVWISSSLGVFGRIRGFFSLRCVEVSDVVFQHTAHAADGVKLGGPHR